MPRLKLGGKAPDFVLKDLNGQEFSLYKHLNEKKTILIFYRGEWCPICNVYLTGFQQRVSELKENNTQIIAISTDTPADATNLQQRLGLSFPVLPGLTREIIESYDLFYNEKFSHNEPVIFILNPDGSVAYEAILSSSLGRPNVDDLLSIISRI